MRLTIEPGDVSDTYMLMLGNRAIGVVTSRHNIMCARLVARPSVRVMGVGISELKHNILNLYSGDLVSLIMDMDIM